MPAFADGGDALLRENVANRINFFDKSVIRFRDHKVGGARLI
jgi:hypothetical protein